MPRADFISAVDEWNGGDAELETDGEKTGIKVVVDAQDVGCIIIKRKGNI